MTLRRLAAVVFCMCAASPLGAQTPIRQGEPRWTPVRIAKWAMLGAAAGFATYALAHSTRAEDAYDGLRRLCDTEPERCRLSAGRYTDAAAEAAYARARREDRRAQVGIVGGQAALLGSVALFIYDLRNGRGPVNIPFPSSSHSLASGRLIVGAGVRLSF